ncbi:MAG: DUF3040 domain-containing protein [Actinomycetaceae bacterium]|nr:DUF3040 domain-containing protein [Actinomycetaceae bacterium]
MALSDYERQMLEELEAQLADEDPSFASTMKPEDSPLSVGRNVHVSLKNVVVGLLIVVAGIAVLVGGVEFSLLPIGFAGVFVVFVGFYYLFIGVKETEQSKEKETVKAKKDKVSFMEKQAQRWENRQQEEN